MKNFKNSIFFCWVTEIRTQTEGFKDLCAQPLHHNPIYKTHCLVFNYIKLNYQYLYNLASVIHIDWLQYLQEFRTSFYWYSNLN